MKLHLPDFGAAKVGDPVAPIEVVMGIPQRNQSLRQSADVVLKERPPIDENHTSMGLSSQRPAFEQIWNGPLVVGDQSQAGRPRRAQKRIIVFAEMGAVFPDTEREHVNFRAVSPDNRRDGWIEMFIQQEGEQGSAGPVGIRQAAPQFFFAHRIVLRQSRRDFWRISTGIGEHPLGPLPRPSQMGRRSGRVQRVRLGHHQNFPNRQRGAHHISLPPAGGVAKLHGRELFVAQGFFDQLRGRLAARLAHAAGETVQPGRLFVGQFESDPGHASSIVITRDSPAIEAKGLVSDGFVEAQNAQREIAEVAKAWGQNDDITVVTVRRNA